VKAGIEAVPGWWSSWGYRRCRRRSVAVSSHG